jgi:hypothetical protein
LVSTLKVKEQNRNMALKTTVFQSIEMFIAKKNKKSTLGFLHLIAPTRTV